MSCEEHGLGATGPSIVIVAAAPIGSYRIFGPPGLRQHPKGRSMGMRRLFISVIAIGLLAACGKKEEANSPQARPPAEVTVIKVSPRDTAVGFEYVGQTESSRQVQIVARVNGFLEKQVYREGSLVKAGQVMFRQDARPFQAAVDAAKGALGQQEARLQVARANLDRVRPLAAKNALSQKDLDNAIGQEQDAAAAVESAKAGLEQAQLNLGYTTIVTPVTGLSSYARVNEGSYIQPTNSLLTYVQQVDPVYVNFSISENDLLKYRGEEKSGQLRLPKKDNFQVQIELGDGSLYPHRGLITFADADFNQQTGTYLLRATLKNPDAALRPGQFVRVRVQGAIRPDAILVPQRAVLQGAQGHFVWIVDKESKVQPRPVEIGSWHGDDWFITRGLAPGDVVVVDGVLRLGPGVPVKIVEQTAEPAVAGAKPASATGAIQTDKK
jgi:membrane fusion protein (multidrug efflux system)